LDLQLKATDRAKTRHRWRWEHGYEGVLDAGKLLIERHGDRGPGKLSRMALLEGLQRREDDSRARAVGEAGDRQARKGHGVLDAGMLHRNLAHSADHVLCAVERGAVGKLREADQVLLVLRRHEA